MSDAKSVKLELMRQAGVLAAPIVAAAAVKSQFAVDPTVQDAALRNLNLFAFEEVEVLYNALKLAYEDAQPNEWPDPTVGVSVVPTQPASTPIPSPGSNLSGLTQVAGTIAQVAGAVAAGS